MRIINKLLRWCLLHSTLKVPLEIPSFLIIIFNINNRKLRIHKRGRYNSGKPSRIFIDILLGGRTNPRIQYLVRFRRKFSPLMLAWTLKCTPLDPLSLKDRLSRILLKIFLLIGKLRRFWSEIWIIFVLRVKVNWN